MSQDLAAGLPAGLVGAWVALLGGVVGSFLNVVIARLPAGESVVHPRSRCPRCRRPIAWYDNLPVLSWLLLRGRCRGCGLPISARYPLVELALAGAALLCWQRHGISAVALAELAFAAVLVALAAIDLDTWLLPNALTWPLLGLGLLGAGLGLTPAPSPGAAGLGAVLGFLVFGAIWAAGEWVLHKETMGFGDVWLLAGLGAWFGPLALLPLILLASSQGAVVGLALLALGKGQPGPEAGAKPAPGQAEGAGDDDGWVPPRHALPFGPFLVAGALEWLWLGGWLARTVGLFEVFG
jgi:leader peptidase (prepilin peptidase)/N-methyltransferase